VKHDGLKRAFAEINHSTTMSPEMQQRYQELLAEVSDSLWRNGYAVLKDGHVEIVIDYRSQQPGGSAGT
jgi:hypothetical protein